MDYQSQAIIIQSRKLSESDKILTLFSPDHGLIDAVAKGAFNPTSKFSGQAQVMNHCEFLLAKGKNLDIIKEIKLINNFKNISKDFLAMNFAYYFLELSKNSSRVEDTVVKQFELVKDFLTTINSQPQRSLEFAINSLWQYIDLQGYKPELDYCTISARKRPDDKAASFFDFENGSIISSKAYEDLMNFDPYSSRVIKLAPGLFELLKVLDTTGDLDESYESHLLYRALTLLNKHLEYRLHIEFRAWKLIQQEIQSLDQKY
ncbi:MAG: DNA repair protein RecO [Candidatus Caenarcaniphilales bacterium]|jgi:DNA repair protein RecO (recombination protein O)|nr:DNA repair protein RecO [Candidatus Caenarcaniphilales bacterium]